MDTGGRYGETRDGQKMQNEPNLAQPEAVDR
jgi:hypothetical protein